MLKENQNKGKYFGLNFKKTNIIYSALHNDKTDDNNRIKPTNLACI